MWGIEKVYGTDVRLDVYFISALVKTNLLI